MELDNQILTNFTIAHWSLNGHYPDIGFEGFLYMFYFLLQEMSLNF